MGDPGPPGAGPVTGGSAGDVHTSRVLAGDRARAAQGLSPTRRHRPVGVRGPAYGGEAQEEAGPAVPRSSPATPATTTRPGLTRRDQRRPARTVIRESPHLGAEPVRVAVPPRGPRAGHGEDWVHDLHPHPRDPRTAPRMRSRPGRRRARSPPPGAFGPGGCVGTQVSGSADAQAPGRRGRRWGRHTGPGCRSRRGRRGTRGGTGLGVLGAPP